MLDMSNIYNRYQLNDIIVLFPNYQELLMGQIQNNVNWGEIHGITLTVAWFVFENIGLWALYFKSYKYSVFVHIFCMSCAAFIMVFGPMLMIVQNGPSIILVSITHELWGFIMFLIMPLLLISGAICKISKDQPSINPQTVYFRNIAHTIFGWLFILLVTVPLLTGWYGTNLLTNCLFGLILVVSPTSFAFYLYLKFFRKKMQCISINPEFTQQGLRIIPSAKDLRIYSQNYFIFANYVYDISVVLGNHPGGFQIIQQVRGREVDRFIYGVDPIELYDVPKVSHSQNSINLAGPPIAVLKTKEIYFKIEDLNQVAIESISCHDKNMMIHTIHFKFLGNDCTYLGYSDLSQIGQYYALTINNKLTRLYTAVNFLQPQNVKFIHRTSKGENKFVKKTILFSKSSSFSQNKLIQLMNQNLTDNENTNQTSNILPLLIKKYNDGKFTSQFLKEDKNEITSIMISKPRGLGLSLDCVKSGNIVIFAGGTGLYPYSDLIDLLFKAKIAEQRPQLQKTIYQSDPVLKSKPFDKFKFQIFLAVNQLQELHPITLYQCNYLSGEDKFKCNLKLKSYNLETMKNYKNLSPFKDRFESVISKQLQIDAETKFYICGPVRFTRVLVNQLIKFHVPTENYRIV